MHYGVKQMSRIKTVTHGEYEILQALLDSSVIAEALERVKYDMVPANDDVAEKRFSQSVASVGQYMQNMCERRLHRLPKNHPEYKVK